jgi:hypothetical protein
LGFGNRGFSNGLGWRGNGFGGFRRSGFGWGGGFFGGGFGWGGWGFGLGWPYWGSYWGPGWAFGWDPYWYNPYWYAPYSYYPDYGYRSYDTPSTYNPDASYDYDSSASYLNQPSSNHDALHFNITDGPGQVDAGANLNNQTPQAEFAPNGPAQPTDSQPQP